MVCFDPVPDLLLHRVNDRPLRFHIVLHLDLFCARLQRLQRALSDKSPVVFVHVRMPYSIPPRALAEDLHSLILQVVQSSERSTDIPLEVLEDVLAIWTSALSRWSRPLHVDWRHLIGVLACGHERSNGWGRSILLSFPLLLPFFHGPIVREASSAFSVPAETSGTHEMDVCNICSTNM